MLEHAPQQPRRSLAPVRAVPPDQAGGDHGQAIHAAGTAVDGGRARTHGVQAARGVPFDQMAVFLRAPAHYLGLLEHACDRVCACTTCHVVVREGFDSLNEQEEKEEDMLDKAWGLEPNSRLSCQAKVAESDLTVEIPKYTINHAKENH